MLHAIFCIKYAVDAQVFCCSLDINIISLEIIFKVIQYIVKNITFTGPLKIFTNYCIITKY